jgi:hypothetical protein
VVIARDDANSEKRRAMAEKIGFDAYGQHHGQLPDPVAQALDRILDHLHAVDEHLALQDRLLHSDTRCRKCRQGQKVCSKPESVKAGKNRAVLLPRS